MSAALEAVGAFLSLDHILKIVYVLNFLIALALIFIDRKSPSVTMAWIMVLFMIPVVGLVLYLVFAQNIASHRIYKMSQREEERLNLILEQQKNMVSRRVSASEDDLTFKWRDLIRLNLNYSDAILTGNSEVDLIYDGREMFSRLCEDIRNARFTIKVCYFIVKNDYVGREFIDLLTEKAREGVKVRLMLDALGSRFIKDRTLREFREAGGEYAFFFKPSLRNILFRINYRNHRKLVIIDNEIGYIGGYNIAREYLGEKKRFGYWRDTQMVIKGDALVTFNERFYMDWRYAAKDRDIDLIERSTAYVDDDSDNNIPVQLVSSGPNSDKEEIKRAFIKMITGARKNIYIQTPYLVPDAPLLEALAMAARCGIDVNIMIPCIPDHPFVYRTTLYNAGVLIDEGAHIYIYDNGFLHAKTLTVDDEVCSVGSSNFDIRSFKLNFETNAFVYDAKTTADMNEQFKRDLEFSHEYTSADRAEISLLEKMAESISRLLTEIL